MSMSLVYLCYINFFISYYVCKIIYILNCELYILVEIYWLKNTDLLTVGYLD